MVGRASDASTGNSVRIQWTGKDKTADPRDALYRLLLSDFVTAELDAEKIERTDFITNEPDFKLEQCDNCGFQVLVRTDALLENMDRRHAQSLRAALRLCELALINPERGNKATERSSRVRRVSTTRLSVATAYKLVLSEVADGADNEALYNLWSAPAMSSAIITIDSVNNGGFASRLAEGVDEYMDRARTWINQHRLDPAGDQDLLQRWISTASDLGAASTKDLHSTDDLSYGETHDHREHTLLKLVLKNSKSWHSGKYHWNSGKQTNWFTAHPSGSIPAYFQIFALLDSAIEYARHEKDPNTRSTITLDYPLPPDFPEDAQSTVDEIAAGHTWFTELNQAMSDFAGGRTVPFNPAAAIDAELHAFNQEHGLAFEGGAARKSAQPDTLIDVTLRQLNLVLRNPKFVTAGDTDANVSAIGDNISSIAAKAVAASIGGSWADYSDDLRADLDAVLADKTRELGMVLLNLVTELQDRTTNHGN